MSEGIEKKANYLFVKDQFYEKFIPVEQIANVVILMCSEKEYADTPCFNIAALKDSYKDEKDEAAYYMAVDGEIVSYNNFRAMAGQKREVLSFNPNANILVHRMGNEINFNLVNSLGIPQDESDGSSFVKRRYERLPYKTVIRYSRFRKGHQ